MKKPFWVTQLDTNVFVYFVQIIKRQLMAIFRLDIHQMGTEIFVKIKDKKKSSR